MNRHADLKTFYNLLNQLEKKIGGRRLLLNCNGSMNWPKKGIYFFMENGEYRSNSSNFRIIRVGTHALRINARSTLWQRLKQHKGNNQGGGNHRGSIFRLIVGTAFNTDGIYPNRGNGNNAPAAIKISELPLEKKVSDFIGKMPFIWLPICDSFQIDGKAGHELRGYIERNSIALLSNYNKEPIDSSSENWLGRKCDRPLVISSGLWNQDHVNENYDPNFLKILEKII